MSMAVVWGYLLALLGGDLFATLFLWRYQPARPEGQDDGEYAGSTAAFRTVSGRVIGHVERLFFVTLVMFSFSGVATAMILWITVKLGANWNAEGRLADEEPQKAAAIRLAAAVAGLISMGFAAAGGLVARL